MGERYTDGWQTPQWNEDTIDPLWLSNFLAADPAQDLAIDAPVDGPATSDFGNLDMNVIFQDFASSETSPTTSALPSPGYFLDAASYRPTERHEPLFEQRQRTLPRRRSKYMIRRSMGTSSPIVIPSGSPQQGSGQSLAIQRWRNSPPEDEAASLSAIYKALDDRPMAISPQTSRPSSRDALRRYRGPSSTTSLDSAASESSLRSYNSSQSATSQTKRRNQAPKTRTKTRSRGKNMNDPERIFKCTFCCDTFKHKYDWMRHEKSLHLNMEEWVCTPHGASVVLPSTGRVHCAYCSALDPTPEHLQQHNHSACTDDSSAPRVFRRKDHLVQHLRLVHGLKTLPLIEDWRVESAPVTCRCGFCNSRLNSWDERADHLAAHFREGKTMANWSGEHGFDAAVAARVISAFPPYLIGVQAATMVPFSATDPASLDHTQQLLSRIRLEGTVPAPAADSAAQDWGVVDQSCDTRILPTQQELDFSSVLALHLSRFARQQMLMGIIPTDGMFQRESRRLLYQDGDDEWNQTVADDPNWMQQFRKRSGLSGAPCP
ncbi:hypothetical protein BDW02DRAFT_110651 [Decorospora gaudefroyi]|uniref:C2H2-type domain-containing protein n=1 Tax=Decorospora gaudefroyi TaxID=184978 RepID=A0A6A5K640_9PLEO|nr:hypothetical protein BDW02DRAFT_110651 [Decorospora gaudefroyi]